jgi:hypothetical protein
MRRKRFCPHVNLIAHGHQFCARDRAERQHGPVRRRRSKIRFLQICAAAYRSRRP